MHGTALTLKTEPKESGSACAMPQADSTSKMRSAVRSTVSCDNQIPGVNAVKTQSISSLQDAVWTQHLEHALRCQVNCFLQRRTLYMLAIWLSSQVSTTFHAVNCLLHMLQMSRVLKESAAAPLSSALPWTPGLSAVGLSVAHQHPPP